MNRSLHYDFAVIGAGPAGIAAAVRAAQLGRSVALIEKGKDIGGAGVHAGVLPSKTMWQSALEYSALQENRAGFRIQSLEADFSLLMERVKRVSAQQVRDWERQLAFYGDDGCGASDGQSPKRGCISRFNGAAAFRSSTEIAVHRAGETRSLNADTVVIATGSSPRQLPQVQADGEFVFTSDEIFSLERFPKSLVIVGAGVIGCEFATIFGSFGETEVHLIDRADRILPFEDADISEICAQQLREKNVIIHQESDLHEIEVRDDQVFFSIVFPDGSKQEHTVEKALISIGRVPNTKGLGLERAGVKLNESGSIENKSTRTTAENIYAVGDVTKDINLVNVGQTEAVHAVETACGNCSGELSYDHISTIMFLDPACAGVGMNEQRAQEEGKPYRAATYSFDLVPRSRITGHTRGFMKVLVGDEDDDLIPIGMRAVGPQASELIEPIALLIRTNKSLRDLADMIHPHPSSTEGLQDLARMLDGRSLYDPDAFDGLTIKHWSP